jgi:hypothetical protein
MTPDVGSVIAAAQPWWPPVLAAAVSLVGVVFVAIYTARKTNKNGKDLATLQRRLDEDRDESSARRAYNFDARKRLYEHLEPAFFRLREQSEAALFRIYGLAKSARDGRLDPAQPELHRLRKTSETYLPSTLYRFMSPLAVAAGNVPPLPAAAHFGRPDARRTPRQAIPARQDALPVLERR